MTLSRFVTTKAWVYRRNASGWQATGEVLAVTPPQPLEPRLAVEYPRLRTASKAFVAFVPLRGADSADVQAGDKLVYDGGAEYIVAAVEAWQQGVRHLRLVLEQR